MQLKANGHEVYGFGERKTPHPFVNACTTFLFVDGLDDPEAQSIGSASKTKSTAKDEAKPASVAKTAGSLAQDTKLVTTLRGGVEAAAREDGWAQLGTAGNAAKRQAPIDPRNYGEKNFRTLFEATGLFEIFKADDGQIYIADKRNADRTPRPSL